MVAPVITRNGNGWFVVSMSDTDADGNTFSFSQSFQTERMAESFIASLGFADYVENSSGLSVSVSPVSIDRMMRSNRSVGL